MVSHPGFDVVLIVAGLQASIRRCKHQAFQIFGVRALDTLHVLPKDAQDSTIAGSAYPLGFLYSLFMCTMRCDICGLQTYSHPRKTAYDLV